MIERLAALLKGRRSEGLILMYHRINKEGMDPWALCVSPEHFEEQLSVIRSYANPISLQQLLNDTKKGKISSRTIVITFDDGYLDNLIFAKPILKKYDIPATFFITTGKVGNSEEFWWDQLEQIILSPGRLPETLNLNINNSSYMWELGDASVYKIEDFKRDFKTKVWRSAPGTRHFLYHSVWEKLYPLNASQREAVLKQLAKWAGIEIKVRESHSIVKEDEIKELEKGELFEIGAHTVSHPPLSSLGKYDQEKEIKESKIFLEKILKYQVKSFAYPHGDYSSDTIDILKSEGFNCSVNTNDNQLRVSANLFELPRKHVEDSNGKFLLRKVNDSFRGFPHPISLFGKVKFLFPKLNHFKN